MASNPSWMELSQAVVEFVRSAARSVVRVEAGSRGTSTGVVWSDEGAIVTVAEGLDDDSVMIGLPSGETVDAEVVGRDASTDLAVVRRRADGLAPPTWGDDPLEVGQLVFTVTRPGRSPKAGLGLVSRLGDPWRTRAGGKVDRYAELDVSLHPGLSGGLVLDAGGRALGLASARLIRGTPLLVPAVTLRRIVADLLAHGSVRRGYLGLSSLPVDVPAALAGADAQRAGLLLTAIEEGSPASRAGLLVGDLLLALDGVPLRSVADLMGCLDPDRIGQALRARIVRGGVLKELEVQLGARGA